MGAKMRLVMPARVFPRVSEMMKMKKQDKYCGNNNRDGTGARSRHRFSPNRRRRRMAPPSATASRSGPFSPNPKRQPFGMYHQRTITHNVCFHLASLKRSFSSSRDRALSDSRCCSKIDPIRRICIARRPGAARGPFQGMGKKWRKS